MEKIAVIGAGMVGRAWAIVFARAGRSVALYDTDANALENALVLIAGAANDLHREGLVDEDAQTIVRRITATTNLGAALAGATYAQENAPETLDINDLRKLDIWHSRVPVQRTPQGARTLPRRPSG